MIEKKPSPSLTTPYLLSQRLRRWQDVMEFTNATAAAFFGIPLRTYTNVLYVEHPPNASTVVLMDRVLTTEEQRLGLPPLESENQKAA